MRYFIVGIDPFSSCFARELILQGEEVIGIDKSSSKVEMFEDDFNSVMCADATDRELFCSLLKIAKQDVVMLFIKNDVAASLLTCYVLLELGISQIHSVYQSNEHRNLLNMLAINTDLLNDRLLVKSWSIKKKNKLKPIIYIDMDGVLADLAKGAEIHTDNKDGSFTNKPDEIVGVFKDLPPIAGAIDAVNQLLASDKYDIFILTTAPWDNPSAWIDKRLWIADKFGASFEKKLIVSHRKDLLIGDYLIDDRTARGAAEFSGKHLHFGWDYEREAFNEYKDWDSILNFFKLNLD